MNTIYTISLNTFKETIRNKVLYNILFFALGILLLTISFGDWSVFARVQVMEDFGLATMSISGLLLSVFIGVGMLGREISTKTVYGVITKPIQRYQFILGKFFGLLLTLFINYIIMALFFWIVLLIFGGQAQPKLLNAILLIWIEMAVLISVAIFFSTITSTWLAAIFTLAFYISGHFNDMVDVAAIAKNNPALGLILKIFYYALPNLEHFNVRDRIVYNLTLPPDYIVLSVLYGFLFVVLFLFLSCIVFSKKDL